MAGAPWIDIPEGSPFPLANLPLGIGGEPGRAPTTWVAVGDHALDLARVHADGYLDSVGLPGGIFSTGRLNEYLAEGRHTWRRLRSALVGVLTDPEAGRRLEPAIRARAALVMQLPVEVGDYVDFYSSLHHATNLGRIFRPDGEPLLPNWRHLPVGYHGRAGTLVPSGAEIPRPSGLRIVGGVPVFGPSERLDIELEMATVVGVGNRRGAPVSTRDASAHLYGMCLLDDWSARDIQAFEYQPLGPFLGKSFATSLSSWVVGFDALEPFRLAPPPQDPPVADYLTCDEPWGFDLHLEVLIETPSMRERGIPPEVVSRARFADMYWTPAQQLAHLTVNGASTRPGDLLGSGTVSGDRPGTAGSLIELTDNGRCPLELPDGSFRTFLLDGDRVVLRGWAGSDPSQRIGFGEVSGTITPART